MHIKQLKFNRGFQLCAEDWSDSKVFRPFIGSMEKNYLTWSQNCAHTPQGQRRIIYHLGGKRVIESTANWEKI